MSGATGGEFGVGCDIELFIVSSYCIQVLLIIRTTLIHIQFNLNSCVVLPNITFGDVCNAETYLMYILYRPGVNISTRLCIFDSVIVLSESLRITWPTATHKRFNCNSCVM